MKASCTIPSYYPPQPFDGGDLIVVSPDATNVQAAPAKTAEEQEAEKLGVSLGKFRAMKEYAALLAKSDRKMKASTVRKKVAQKFNIKLQ